MYTIKQGMMGLISFVYPNILHNMSDRKWLAGRAILSPLNNAVDEINELCLNEIPGNLIVCNSTNTTIQLDDATRFPTEYLNSISVNGIPPHRLLLKIGAPIMLLRNINPREGLCNGTRLILTAKHGEMLQCQIAGTRRKSCLSTAYHIYAEFNRRISNGMEKTTIPSPYIFCHDNQQKPRTVS